MALPIRTYPIAVWDRCNMTADCEREPVLVVETIHDGVRFSNLACHIHAGETFLALAGRRDLTSRIRAITDAEQAKMEAA